MKKLHKLSAKFLDRIGNPRARMISLVFSFCLLFSGCYTYKKIETVKYEIKPNKTYRIITETLIKKKVKVIEVTDSEIVGRINMENVVIPVSEIRELRKRKFSYLKTLSIPVVYTGVLFLGYSNSNMISGVGGFQFPN